MNNRQLPLTKRERQVVQLVATGLSNKEIGRRLDIEVGTVKCHIHNVMKKLGLGSRTKLTMFYYTHKNKK